MSSVLRVVVCLFFFIPSLLPAPITISVSGGPIADYDVINAAPGVTFFEIPVPNAGVVGSGANNVQVRLLGFQHTFASDLEVSLTQEAVGVSRTLFSRIGVPGSPANSNFNDNYSFSSGNTGDLWATAVPLGDINDIPGESTLPPTAYYPTSAGSSAPNDFSTAFAGISATGVWRLTITDFAEGDIGDLLGWELTLDVEQVPESSTVLLVVPALFGLAFIRRGN